MIVTRVKNYTVGAPYEPATYFAARRDELCGTLHAVDVSAGIIITLGLARGSDPLLLNGVWQSHPLDQFVFYSEEAPYLGLRIA